jgi:hypothetical protein
LLGEVVLALNVRERRYTIGLVALVGLTLASVAWLTLTDAPPPPLPEPVFEVPEPPVKPPAAIVAPEPARAPQSAAKPHPVVAQPQPAPGAPNHGLVPFAGRVVGPDGQPVPQAAVYLQVGEREERPSVDGGGRFSGVMPADELARATLQAVTPTHEPSPRTSPRGGQEVELRLGAGGFLEGRVVDESGQPIAPATVAVEALRVDGPEPFGPRAVPPVQVAGDGTFKVGPLRPGSYDLRADSPGLATGYAKGAQAGRGGTTGGVRIVLQAGAKVRGRVTNKDNGAPVQGARVTLIDPTSMAPPKSAETDADGNYVIAGVAPGRRSMHVRHADFLPQIVAGVAVQAAGDVVRDVVLDKPQKGERLSFHGIGATLGRSQRGVEVQGLVEGSPAAGQGLQQGDVIRRVDGTLTQDLLLPQVVEMIRGEAGVPVALEIEREGQGRFTVRIERGRVVIKQNEADKPPGHP